MRIIAFLISAGITIGLIFVMNHRWSVGGNKTPPIGKFLSPQQGFWQNAEPTNADFSINLTTPLLHDKVDVYLDDRLVPHVFAQNEHDAYFVQGYLHAKFRLWQMEFQTHAAAGRLAELIGAKKGDYSILDNDRYFRRLGMGMAAENSLKAIEANPDSKTVCDAYTAGINYYIDHLKPEDYPVEYKLLDYAPEKWTNLKTALFLKYMSYDLAGYEEDFERTNAKAFLSKTLFEQFYPYGRDSLDPIIPKGTVFEKPGVQLKIPSDADSVYYNYYDSTLASFHQQKPDPANGSNNWAVNGSKTASGRPILCGDPHLGLNLPSLWYEMQLHTPGWNVYGVSFPGAPAIAIGFNDSIAWSETNAMRDVRDYYSIQFKDASQQAYWFDGAWKQTAWRVDTIKIRDRDEVYLDSIPLTVFGPVIYEKRFDNKLKDGKAYAVRWKAHDPSNDGWTFVKLVRAKNYNDYVDAIKTFECPGQNFVFAAKNGDIAMWNQGAFPAKWYRQGDFVMPGTDSSYLWQGIIPMNENPHMLNPVRGFVSSANQLPVDVKSYPYYLGGSYDLYRGIIINKMLSGMRAITPDSMKKMQTDNYNIFAATALPVLLRYTAIDSLKVEEKNYMTQLQNWDYKAEPRSNQPTIFNTWWSIFEGMVWDDEIEKNTNAINLIPHESVLLEAIIRDTAFSCIDDKRTPQKETLRDIALHAFKKAAIELDKIKYGPGPLTFVEGRGDYDNLSWEMVKGTRVQHLMKLPSFSSPRLDVGGGAHIINATKSNHGPSWRMIVHLTDQTEAYGVYPGGQSGNPGSSFYDNFISTWEQGKYYSLWMMTQSDINNNKIKWRMTFNKG